MSSEVGQKELVKTIVSASIEVVNEQREIIISATGQVTGQGWTEPELVPFVYIQPPEDGYYDFNLVALPPPGPVKTIPVVVSAKAIFPAGAMKGARIHSASNKVEVPPQSGDGGNSKA